MTKALRKTAIEGSYLSITKATYNRPIGNFVLNGEKLKPFPLKSGMRQGCPLLDPKDFIRRLLDLILSAN
jgi:hypothetical protein